MEDLQREIFNHYAEKWLQRNYKEVFLGERLYSNEKKMLGFLSISMMASDEEIQQHKDDAVFREIAELLSKLSEQNLQYLEQLFSYRKQYVIDCFNQKLQEIELLIINEKQVQINQIIVSELSPEKKAEIVSRVKQGCFRNSRKRDLVDRYNHIQSELQITVQLMEVLKPQSLLEVDFEKNNNWVDRVAFLIYKPEIVNQESFVIYDEWDDFPLKWSLYYKSVPEGRLVFSQYLKTKDLNFYYSNYEVHTIKELEQVTTNKFLHKNVQDRYPLIKEALENYQDQRYASTVLLSLSIIEGLLWDLSKMIYKLEGKIYNDHGIMLDSVTGNVIKENKIRELLKRTEMKDYLYMPFIEYFCEELYEERNPIMHGRDIKRFEKSNALQKLFALENVLKEFQSYNEKQMMKLFEQFDDRAKDFFRKIKE